MRPESNFAVSHLKPMQPIPTGETPRGLKRLVHIQAILFDVYGTLIISRAGESNITAEHSRQELMDKLLRHYEIAESSDTVGRFLREAIDREHARLIGQGIDYPEVDILEIWRSILDWDDLSQLKTFAQAYETMINPVYPMPGLMKMLQSCRERALTMGLISNAQFYTQGLLENMLAEPLVASGFDPQLILVSYQYQLAKPSVVLFEMAAKRLRDTGIQPEVSLFVGNDMRKDVLPAKTVGFQTALFAGDQRSLRWRQDDPCCRDVVPDMVVTDLRQLILKE